MSDFIYQTERFADIRILRYQVPEFENLTLKQKKLAFFLSEAALAGRDIFWDQNYKHNLFVRKNLENIFRTYGGNREEGCFIRFSVYMKQIWFSNGIHHHYSNEKLLPDFSWDCFDKLVEQSDAKGFELGNFADIKEMTDFFEQVIFNSKVDAKKVNLSKGEDLVKNSAVNFYDNISQDEVEKYYNNLPQNRDEPISYGLNSKIVKEDGQIKELVWKKGGLYDEYITQINANLEMALPFCESEIQRKSLEKLIEYYETGDLKKFDEYSILWVSDTDSDIDVINGFIEVYDDPLGRKATFESTVSVIDKIATKRAKLISENADWFEQNSTTDRDCKKQEIKGVSAKAINVIMESGACSPSTPIGINLPNADWIRSKYGSKSVSISNIIQAYDEVSKTGGALEEFALDEAEIQRSKKWSSLGSNLHVDMHEIIGHGSGKMMPGVGDTAETLKSYASTIEEARADLVALYFAIDEKLIELGLMPSLEPGFAEYSSYIRSGLMTQLVRIEKGKNLEESHMRNRQLIAQWAYDLGKGSNVIEKVKRNGKTYFRINDYQKLRDIFGVQLRNIQRIKSDGDYEGAQYLVEKYGVVVDKEIHEEVLERWSKLNIPAYSGFLNPQLEAVWNGDEIMDVKINYPDDFAKQMLGYSSNIKN